MYYFYNRDRFTYLAVAIVLQSLLAIACFAQPTDKSREPMSIRNENNRQNLSEPVGVIATENAFQIQGLYSLLFQIVRVSVEMEERLEKLEKDLRSDSMDRSDSREEETEGMIEERMIEDLEQLIKSHRENLNSFKAALDAALNTFEKTQDHGNLWESINTTNGAIIGVLALIIAALIGALVKSRSY